MIRTSTRVAVMAGLTMLWGCAGLAPRLTQRPTERLDERGISAPALIVEAGSVIEFVNADARSHQIYSNDCGELSSMVLNPGDTYALAIGLGPKLCHFQDLLAPLSAAYSGTIEVHDEQENRRRETSD
jgi:hypothetical protein